MSVSTHLKTKISILIYLFAAIFTLLFPGCKKKRPEMANALFRQTQNNIFKSVTPEGFKAEFIKTLDSESSKLSNHESIKTYYDHNEFEPELLMGHLFNSDLDSAISLFKAAYVHGLNPAMFHADEIQSLVSKFRDKNGIKNIDEAYRDMAELEILAANSLITYSKTLQYGLIDPKKIYTRYYTKTKRPDSSAVLELYQTGNLKAYLDSIQPKDPQYLMLQKALLSNFKAPGLSQEETKRIILVNMERLRWKNKPTAAKYVIVNIPDYSLSVMEDSKSMLTMKVCVGEGRNKTNDNTLMSYNDTAKADKPYSKETPQLNSLIHSAQVNPVWNIPESIANKEIMVEAAKDRYYLSNKGIDVYKNGKLLEAPEDINWAAVDKGNSDYEFKQRPGDDNSLGKIKFLFDNESGVYLHDTPAKAAFNLAARDVSHGCVRIQDPQGLALNLFGEGPKYQRIATDMSEERSDPTTIYLPKKVPVFITYVTCWANDANTLQFRQDVYGLDIVLYDQLIHAGI